MKLTIKRGDTARNLTDTLMIGGNPIDLTGSVVTLIWSIRNGDVSRKDAAIVESTEGTVLYDIQESDVERVGIVFVEWEITFIDGKVLTVPTEGYIKLTISEDLG